jgi:putative phosphonate metabolism protein
MSARYAIFYAPGGEMRVAGESWLGRTVDPAVPPPVPAVPEGWDRDQVDAITRSAWRYGFHATLKAPFRLAEGRDAAELTDRLATFAAKRSPVVVPDVRLSRLGLFFALTAGRASADLRALADDVVREFDDLRAPLTEADIARRRPDRLGERERELLYQYGYPYVLDRFRFHMTLTDAVPLTQHAAVEPVLRRHFAHLLGRDLVIGSLALFVEPEPGKPLLLVSSYPFTKGAQ